MRKLLAVRDLGCTARRCSVPPAFCDAHHLVRSADGGSTTVENLVLLCRFHHRQVHEGNVRVRRLDDGALQFSRCSDGQPLEAEVRGTAGSLAALLDEHQRQGLRITAQTAATR